MIVRIAIDISLIYDSLKSAFVLKYKWKVGHFIYFWQIFAGEDIYFIIIILNKSILCSPMNHSLYVTDIACLFSSYSKAMLPSFYLSRSFTTSSFSFTLAL